MIVLVLSQLYSCSQRSASPLCAPGGGRRVQPMLTEYDVAKWLDRERKIENCTKTVGLVEEEDVSLIAAEDDALWGTTVFTGQKLGFPYAGILMDSARGWYKNEENEVRGSYVGAKVAACL